MTKKNNDNPGTPNFKRWDLVKFTDGDGRPHQIKKVEWNSGMGRPNDGWWEYIFVDNKTAQEFELVRFIDENLLERILGWLENVHYNEYMSSITSGVGVIRFNAEDFINDFKEYIQNGSKE